MLNNTIALKPSEIKELIKQRWRNRHIKTRPICIVGHKGVGKSDIVRQAAAELAQEFSEMDVSCRTVNLQFCEPPDFLGLPMVDRAADGSCVTRHARPELVPTEGAGIWFMDEFNRCSRDNRAGMLTLIQDRMVNGHPIGKDWIIVGAMNPVEADGVSYETSELDAALEDRICKVEFKGDVDEFIKYMVARYTDKNPVVRWVMNQPEVVDFKGKLRTSPRGLDYLVAGIEANGGMNTGTTFNVIAAEIGTEAAHVFNKFLHSPENISAEEVIDNFSPMVLEKLGALEKDGRNDVLNSLVETVCILLAGRNEVTNKNLKNLVQYLEASGAETRQAFFLILAEKATNNDALFNKVTDYIVKNSKEIVKFLEKNDQHGK